MSRFNENRISIYTVKDLRKKFLKHRGRDCRLTDQQIGDVYHSYRYHPWKDDSADNPYRSQDEFLMDVLRDAERGEVDLPDVHVTLV